MESKPCVKCPECSADVWDVQKIGQALSKCWECGLRFMDFAEED